MRFVVRLVDACRRHAGAVVSGFLALTIVCLWITATGIQMNTDTDSLISPELPWKKLEADVDRSFPQLQHLLVAVIDAPTPGEADAAADALQTKLQETPALFPLVRRGDDPFLRKNGLLYMDLPALKQLAERLTAAQPLIGTLAADPSPRGLLQVIDLAVMAAQHGQDELAQMKPLFEGIAGAADGALAGQPRPVPWYSLFTGNAPSTMELRRFVMAQPAADFDARSPDRTASETMRAAARSLGLSGVRVRVTGTVAMEEEEFATVAKGTKVSGSLSFVLVGVVLFLALRSARLIVPVLLTLVAGLAATFAFAVVAAGELNSISIAFAVMFIGMAVDFGIQVAIRYRDRRFVYREPQRALIDTARTISAPLVLAAATTAAGFLAFIPTDFDGLSQLGLIAGAGMVVAVVFNLTLLPALLVLFHPPAEEAPIGYPRLLPVDRWLAAHARAVALSALALGLAAATTLPRLSFDFNPLNLRDPTSEAVSTGYEMMEQPDTSPFTIEIMTPSPADAAKLSDKLQTLPEVYHALSIASFVPEDQDAKLAILGDLDLMLGPALAPPAVAPPPTAAAIRKAVETTAAGLRGAGEGGLADRLQAVAAKDDATVEAFGRALTAGLAQQLVAFAQMMPGEKTTVDSIPADYRRDWVAADGRARVEVTPKGDGRDPQVLVDFVRAVRGVAPDVTGTAVTIQESANVIVGAFIRAGLIALAAIVIVLTPVLRRPLDVALVLAPLALGVPLTAALLVSCGWKLNFANIIALPLLIGIGVAFAIYYVVNARAGETELLASSTTRAVFYSACTTAVSFGSLGLSAHLGTASMGILLLVGLAMTLLCTFTLLPALLALTRRRT